MLEEALCGFIFGSLWLPCFSCLQSQQLVRNRKKILPLLRRGLTDSHHSQAHPRAIPLHLLCFHRCRMTERSGIFPAALFLSRARRSRIVLVPPTGIPKTIPSCRKPCRMPPTRTLPPAHSTL